MFGFGTSVKSIRHRRTISFIMCDIRVYSSEVYRVYQDWQDIADGRGGGSELPLPGGTDPVGIAFWDLLKSFIFKRDRKLLK